MLEETLVDTARTDAGDPLTGLARACLKFLEFAAIARPKPVLSRAGALTTIHQIDTKVISF